MTSEDQTINWLQLSKVFRLTHEGTKEHLKYRQIKTLIALDQDYMCVLQSKVGDITRMNDSKIHIYIANKRTKLAKSLIPLLGKPHIENSIELVFIRPNRDLRFIANLLKMKKKRSSYAQTYHARKILAPQSV